MSGLRGIVKSSILTLGACLNRNKKSKLLYYHDVYEDVCYTDMGTPWSLFAQHLDVINREGFELVPSIEKTVGQVAILLDDGFRGIYDCRELFYERQICPTVFLAVSLIGQPGYLAKDEILELQRHGFSFQSHGWTHKDLTQFDNLELNRELVDSKQYLCELLGKEISEICLPIGCFSDNVIEKALEAGYTTIYSSLPGNYEELVYGMRSRNLVQHSSPQEVRLILNGGNSLLRRHYIRIHRKG